MKKNSGMTRCLGIDCHRKDRMFMSEDKNKLRFCPECVIKKENRNIGGFRGASAKPLSSVNYFYNV